MTSFPFSDTRKESEMVLEMAKFLLTTLQKPALPFLVLLPVCAKSGENSCHGCGQHRRLYVWRHCRVRQDGTVTRFPTQVLFIARQCIVLRGVS